MIVATAISKGGQGKTTLTTQIARFMKLQFGLNILVIDNDPQSNLSQAFGLPPMEEIPVQFNTLSLYKDNPTVPLKLGDADVIASDRSLDLQTRSSEKDLIAFQKSVRKISADYDLTLIDCPPSSSLLGWGPLFAADVVLIPASPAQFSSNGIRKMVDHVETVQGLHNPELAILGIVVNLFDPRRNLHVAEMVNMTDTWGDLVFQNMLGNRNVYEEAIRHRKCVSEMNREKKAKTEFLGFMEEFIHRAQAKGFLKGVIRHAQKRAS